MAVAAGHDSPVGTGALMGDGRARPLRTRRELLADGWRSFATATRLGWKTEANWADPLLFFIYSVAKPVAGALILVVMLEVIGGSGNAPFRAFVVVGTALWAFVVSGIAGLALSVLEDRERYRMLRYLYVSPSEFVVLLLGRGTARVLIGAMGAVITLAVGILFLGVPLDLAGVDWLLFVGSMLLGVGAILAFGLLLAAVAMQVRQEAWSYPEAVAGALFLLVGAVFPLSVLPLPLQAAGLLTPLTWWIEGVRAAVFPSSISSIGGPGTLYTQLTGRTSPGPTETLVALLLTGVLVTLATAVVFRWSERRAKERGLFDQTTGS